MSSISPPTSYSPSQPFGTSYIYEDPTHHQLQPPVGYPTSYDERPQQQALPARGGPKPQHTTSEPKVRLRKACDSCSVRKVKVCVVCFFCGAVV